MVAIRYYTDTMIDYEVAKLRYEALIDKKEEIYIKYFGMKSPQFSDMPKTPSHVNRDKMIAYLEEVEQKKYNGTTLQEQIDNTGKEVERLKLILDEMAKKLAKLDSIEDRLYYEIVVNKQKVSKAVATVAEKCYTSETNVWKHYYPKIKEDIYKIKKVQ